MTARLDYAAGGAGEDVATSERSHRFTSVGELEPIALLDGLRARAVDGEHVSLAIVELAPGLRMPEHRHRNEQVGIVLRGEFDFSVGGESRVRRVGDMWVIPPGVPHAVVSTGVEGCTVAEVFAPPRDDWAEMEREQPGPSRWP